jgi:hypothetical protein
MKNTFLPRTWAALAAGVLLLAGCGGGGDSTPAPRFTPSSQLAGVCTVAGQKQFVRSYLDEVYLWYDQIQDVDAAQYATPEAYFDALLVKSKDNFSRAFYTGPARSLQSAQPLAAFGNLQGAGANAVTKVDGFTVNGRQVGYIQFDNQMTGAQDELIGAFQQVKANGAQDLVLDLRRNSGGFLYVGLTAASMVTGPGSEGQVFEQLRFNNKRADSPSNTLRFSGHVQFAESTYPVGSQLPQLNLPRVFVLTSPDTCSASESIINSLRGIDVQVVRIGDRTCGKPYGFHEESTCGGSYQYFAIEFQGFNAKGFGDYQDVGFAPTCQVADGGTRGDPNSDKLLMGALSYVANGTCPAGTGPGTTGIQSAAQPLRSAPRTPAWGTRLLRPEQQSH